MQRLAVLALLALLALPAAGLEPYLVKDINPVPEPAGSNPSYPVTLGGAVLFFAHDGLSPRQLWRSDGTAAGTWRLTEAPGGLGEAVPYAVTERLYFFLDTSQGLWVSDGTPAGTFPLTDRVRILPSRLWVASQGVLYFGGQDFEHGSELWRTDGTVAGTRLVADVHAGAAGSGLRWLTQYKGRVWFGADDGHRGGALWSTDGTAAGTVLAIDPLRSAPTKPPEFIQVVGNRITFFARSSGPSRDLQLWAGDGTPGGTAPVTRLSGGKRRSLYESVVRGNRLYFVAEDQRGQELWISDGTARGTRPLTRFPKADAFYSTSFDRKLPRHQGLPGLFAFLADDGLHGDEPWVTDGTPEGTRLLRDVCSGACSSYVGPWTAFAGRLYFNALELSHGFELWSTDGTEAGTRVSDVCPGDCGSHPHGFFGLGNRLLFVAQGQGTGEEIWSTDGTEGIVRVSDFLPEFIWTGGRYGFQGAVLNGQLLFGADDGGPSGMELWRTDGTAAGTRLVEDLNRTDTGGSRPHALRTLGNEVIFAADGGAPGLWKSDGTAAGTVRFKTFGTEDEDGAHAVGGWAEAAGLLFYFSFEPGHGRRVPWRTDGTDAGTLRLTDAGVQACCTVEQMRAVGSTVFFDLADAEHGRELWASDGTPEGTRLVRDVRPGTGSSSPRELTAFAGRLWFSAEGSSTGREIWVSDGTEAGTARVGNIARESSALPALFTVHAGRLWFFAEEGEHGLVLWSSDGTAAGTVPAVGFEPGDDFFRPLVMAAVGGRLVVSVEGRGLWSTDGTPAGTRQIHDLEVDTNTFGGVRTVFQDRLYYVAQGSTAAVWVTDGTVDGTRPLLDRDGEPLTPLWFAVLGDRLLIAAQDEIGRMLLWQSDGTPAGTFQVQPPVFPGFEPVRAGDRVFFPAYDPATGWELWAVRP